MSRTSQRKLIRSAIKALVLNQTDCGDRVYLNRFTPVWDETFPLMMIYTLDEPASVWAEAPREMERKLRVSIEIICKDGSVEGDIDDVLDDVCQQVEDRMRLDHTLGELCKDVVLQSTEYQASPEGEKVVAAARITYEVTYYSVEVAIDDETVLPDFTKLTTEITGQVGDGAIIESTAEPELDPEEGD